jgi:signal transduction histidine kinase
MKLRIRDWPIRAKILALMVPPLVSLLALWIFATSLTAGSALGLLATQTNYNEAGKPAESMTLELQRERKLSQVFLGSGRTDRKALADQRPRTDAAIESFRRHANSSDLQDASTDAVKQRLREISTGLDALVSGREAIDLGQTDRAGAMKVFGTVIDAVYRMYGDLGGIDEPQVGKDSRSVIALSRAREVLAQEDALLNGAAAAGKFAAGEQTQIVQLIGAQRFLFAEASAQLPKADFDAYQRVAKGEAATTLRDLENRLVADVRPNAAVPVDMSVWRASYDKVVEDLRAVEYQTGEGIVARSRPVGISIFVRLGVAAVGGLLALALSILLSVYIGRSLVRRLTGLRQNALTLSDERLPAVMNRLRRGGELDTGANPPPLDLGTDEIGALGQAFNAVQRTAVDSAIKEAQLRRGLSEVFLNIARRSQTLLHRQLALLDRMERRASDPEELEDLFRADHLATRMRRHAEDLVILAGATPGRGWRNPVPMVDVIRGAVSEVEDYARVSVHALPEASLAGRAVADVIHLLAELIENATSYSPPHTKVQIGGQLVPNGFALEIEDRGLGMSPDAIEDANERLLHPPDFDPAYSARLGLFVVALLATRHGIRVTLRSSPYGGITVVVLIPPDLIVSATGEALPSGLAALGAAPAIAAVAMSTDLAEEPLAEAVAPVLMLEQASVEPVEEVATVHSLVPADVTDDGLPRRHRQANLAPQLRTTGPGADGAAAAEPKPVATRTPERMRAMMSSFQAGFTRGRRDAARLAEDAAQPLDGDSP